MRSRTSKHKAVKVAILGMIRHYRECLTRALVVGGTFMVMDGGAYEPADLARLASLRPDVLLLDLTSTTESVALLQSIGALLPDAALVAIDGNAGDSEILAYFEAGVTAFVPRSASLKDLEEVIEGASRHELQCPPRVTAVMIRRLKEFAGKRPATAVVDRLSPREHAVLGLVEQGLTNKQIAVRLGIEAATVKNHVHRILAKLSVHRRGEAASYLRRDVDRTA